jgi:hypothetical protein
MGQTLNRTRIALACWLARTGWARSAWRPTTTGHHSRRAALRGVSVSRFARAVILRYVTQYNGRNRAVTLRPVVWPGSIGPGQTAGFHCPRR